MKSEICILVAEIHPRVDYTFQWMMRVLGFTKTIITPSIDLYNQWEGPKLCYVTSPEKEGLWLPFKNESCLWQNNLPYPEVQQSKDTFLLFPLDEPASISFDLPLAVFWMLSRAEEYIPGQRDNHSRFTAAHSLAGQQDFLHLPVVDQWVRMLGDALCLLYPGLNLPINLLHHFPSYDVDFAWRYQHKSILGLCRSLGRDLLTLGPRQAFSGLQSALQLRRDPFDCYDQWEKEGAILFFPLGDAGSFDRNMSWKNPAYQRLIKTWVERGYAGLHPSYVAAFDHHILEMEVERYQEITGKKPSRSRQHYLRFSLPETYRALSNVGIVEDWTMGYADAPGFRAGTIHPFPWFDLEANGATDLIIHPIVVMDVTLNHYLKLQPDQAMEVIKQLWEVCQPSGGEWVSLWHNNSVACVDNAWNGWEKVVPHWK